MQVRLDKWLHAARAFKTRTQATRACDLGRVRVNGAAAKPHRALREGDRLEIEQRDWTRLWIVKELRDRPLPKADAARLYEDLSPPRPLPDPVDRLRRRPPVRREAGSGRPTKRDRRRLQRQLRSDRAVEGRGDSE